MFPRTTRPRSSVPFTLSLAALASLTFMTPAVFSIPTWADSPAQTPDTPDVVTDNDVPPTWPAGGAHDFMGRITPAPMGDNTAVRLWVHGDGSGAILRVRLLNADSRATLAHALPQRPAWISRPVAIKFTGWRPVTLAKSQFTLAVPPSAYAHLNPALPACAQIGDTDTPPTASDWSAINALVLETRVAKRSALDIDDIAWATLGSDGKAASQTVVDDFEKGVGSWQTFGSQADSETRVVGLATLPANIHRGKGAYRLAFESPAARRQAILLPAAKRAMAGKPYLVFAPATTFAPILPYTLPEPGAAFNGIALTMCATQTQAASFCVYSPQAVKDVTASLFTNLQGFGHVIPRANVALHVIRVQQQSGAGPLQDPDSAGPSPALLVKDDRASFSGTAPDVRLTGDPITDISADSTKQFWLTVTVPRNTPPGRYSGRVNVTSRTLPAFSVPLEITVLPMRLLTPAKEYGIDLRSRLDPAPATLPSADGTELVTDFVSPAMLNAQLANIAAHGFRIASLYDSSATVWNALGMYQTAGIDTGTTFYKGDGDPATIENERRRRQGSAGYSYYYACPDPLTSATSKLADLHGKRLSVSTYVTSQSDYDAFQANMDVPIYNFDGDYAQSLIRTNGARTSSKHDWWYWSATDANPRANRLASGLLLWKANLYGAWIPDYQTAFGADPYDEACAGAAATKAAFRPLMLTYPAKDGVLDTVQWEAVREGITDVRYLTTLALAIGDCRHVYKIAGPLTDEAEAFEKAYLTKPLTDRSENEFDKLRLQVAAYAIKLQAQIEAYKKAHHLQ